MHLSTLIRNPRIHALIILIACAVCYINTLHVPFHFDDQIYILENPAMHDSIYFMESPGAGESGSLSGTDRARGSILYHYLVNRYVGMFSLYVNYRLGGTEVLGYHLFNIAVHMANALLVYLLFHLTMRTPAMNSAPRGNPMETDDKSAYMGPLFAALVFATHPLQTQAVTYISQRFTSLATLFYLASLTSYAAMRLQSAGWRKWSLYALALASAILGMKTKEICLTLPIMIALYEWLFMDGKTSRRLAGLAPFLATTLIIPLTVLHINRSAGDMFGEISAAARADTDLSRLDYLTTQFTVVAKYLRLFVLPVGQNLDYDYPLYTSLLNPRVIGSLTVLLALVAAGAYLFRKKPDQRIAAFGIAWFFLAHSVESSLIPIKDLIFEHRMYLPMVGLVMALGSFIAGWKGTAQAKVTVMAIVVIALSGATIARNTVWKSEVALWEDTASKSPKKARAINNLAHSYINAGMKKEGLALSMRSLAQGETKEALLNVAGSFFVSGMYGEALKYTQKAIDLDPYFAYSYQMLGAILLANEDFKGAREALLKATSMGPYLADSFALLSSAYGEDGHLEAALEAASRAVELDPNNIVGLSNLGMGWASVGKYDEAIKVLSAAVKIDPSYDLAHFNLMLSYLNVCRTNEAEREFKALSELNPQRAKEIQPQVEDMMRRCNEPSPSQ